MRGCGVILFVQQTWEHLLCIRDGAGCCSQEEEEEEEEDMVTRYTDIQGTDGGTDKERPGVLAETAQEVVGGDNCT